MALPPTCSQALHDLARRHMQVFLLERTDAPANAPPCTYDALWLCRLDQRSGRHEARITEQVDSLDLRQETAMNDNQASA